MKQQLLALHSSSPARSILVALALCFVAASCGDDGAADDGGRSGAHEDGGAEHDGGEEACEPERARPIAGALAFERALIERGRNDASFAALLGEDAEALLGRADALRTELVEEAARD